MIIAPTKPVAVAAHRAGPTRSPKKMRAPRMMKKGDVITSAIACQIGTCASPITQA